MKNYKVTIEDIDKIGTYPADLKEEINKAIKRVNQFDAFPKIDNSRCKEMAIAYKAIQEGEITQKIKNAIQRIDNDDVVSENYVHSLVDIYANKYGVDNNLAHYIVSHESGYNPNAIGDLNVICKRTGEPAYSRGLMQITRCYYSNITDEQAFNPEFNLDFGMKLASNKETCISQFSTCKDYYNKIKKNPS